jgi:branched-chain amino acid transport system ATP-binding protein
MTNVSTATDPGLAADPEASALSARDITVRFGGLTALSNVSLDVPPGSIVGLVGPNGAGKSTLLGVLSGLLKPNDGSVWLRGENVTATSVRKRAARGLARTFQKPELFIGLTVREHLVLADRVSVSPQRVWRDMFDVRSILRPSRAEDQRVDGLLDLLRLTPIAQAPVDALPLGLVRLVEVGRALASNPRVLLLDEPLSGLDISGSENLLAVFRRIVAQSEQQLSVVIVEHDVAAVLALSDSVVVLDFGERIAVGTPEEVRNNPAVRSAYLGDGEPPKRSEESPPSAAPTTEPEADA